MPVTIVRYSASLDRTYEEGGGGRGDDTEAPQPPLSDANTTCHRPEHWNDAQTDSQPVSGGVEEGLSDSMDSLGLEDDSNSSTTSGHSRQHSSDGGGSSNSYAAPRPLSTISPRPPPFNPLQFVKTTTSPLVKKAEAQIKQFEEVKKVKELVKEEAEEWQSNLDVWKNRRRLVSQQSVQRVEESKQIEEELERTRRKSKTLTFSEMMEERSKRGTSKSLPSVFNPEDWPVQVPLAVEEDLDDAVQHEEEEEVVVEKPNGNGVSQNGHKKTPSNGHDEDTNRWAEREQLSGFEEAIRSYAEYAEETNNKARTKTDISSVENNNNNGVTTHQEVTKDETSTKEIREVKEFVREEPGRTLMLSVHLRRQSEHKDFGFSIKSVKGVGTEAFVENVQAQSPAESAGLQVNDELLAINGERCTSDRSHSAIVFAIKQAVYTGQLQLTIYRYDHPNTVIQHQRITLEETERPSAVETVQKVDVGKRRSLFERTTSPERVILNRRSLDLSITLKDKVASFEAIQPPQKVPQQVSKTEDDFVDEPPTLVRSVSSSSSSGIKFGFELASTLQETPIVDSAPNSPSAELDSMLSFDLSRREQEEEHEVVTENEPLAVLRIQPPNEKPPPPPPVDECDPAADPAFNKTVKLRRVESTKRILKEIHKRRSDFLGIEDDEFQKQLEQQMSAVSPPPSVDEMLLRLGRESVSLNTTASDEHSFEASSSSPDTSIHDIDQKEREIIESLEQWEEEQKLKVCADGVVEAEKLTICVPEASTAVEIVLGESGVGSNRKEKTLEEKELELKEQEERLRNEKEKLRREQEELIRQKKEYEKQIERIQKQQIHMQTAAVQVGLQAETSEPKQVQPPKVTAESPPTGRPLSKAPPPPVMTKPHLNEGSSFSSTDDEASSPIPTHQVLTKPNLVALSAPPKAKLMDGEEWMQRRKRENYHQHWLVQEAEFRRLQAAVQVKDGLTKPQQPPQVEDRLMYQTPSSPSKHHVIDMESPPPPPPLSHPHPPPGAAPSQRSPLRQMNGSNGMSEGGHTQGHLQKPAPRPPAKPVFQRQEAGDRSLLPPSPPKLNPPPSHPLFNQNLPSSNNSDTQILSVSGKKRCSHCAMELGRGAAMIIESLQLFYHIGCFKCCVCHIQLGNGSAGTDVRVRSQKLHCHNCYSNDEGLKFSKV